MTDPIRRRNNPLDVQPGAAAPQGPRPIRLGEIPPADPDNRFRPPAPGAQRSPQVPGQTPDRSSVPGYAKLPVPPAKRVVRPLTECGTAQQIMRVYELAPGEADNPARWEQATAAYEEIRKADPSLLTPMRPAPGYNLAEDDADLSVLPDAEGTAPALQPGKLNPQEGPQKVSPSDAVIPDQTKAPTGPEPGDAVSPAGTLPAVKDGQTDVQPAPGRGPSVAPQ